ncbi:fused MFS/spermidine synthase [Nocardioides sp. cx-169]|uniref:spermidine synthase n=1 Tax=Nocardioides sp. cx-169 TaxID=2899080 RepID=UPI001E3778B4|nr:fused MFS/spermidine synthase [Nocardioides sp. cx-169]MCD4536580.1 fused MFS/spermidine synthase [Nocardioides sp. cx-169]
MWELLPTERARAFVLRHDGRDQSYVDLDDPTYLAFDYVRRMGDVVDVLADPGVPVRVVHVGGAGMTLPRYIAATRPTSAQVVLEPDTEVTELVRTRLPLPRRSGIKVRPVDGRAGVAALPEGRADLVVLDAYADGRVPADLVTLEQAAAVARALGPVGHYLLNLSDRAPFAHTRRVVAGVREHLPHLALGAEPATLRGRREGNLMLWAGRVALPVAALRRRASESPAPYRVLDGRLVSDSFGGGAPFHQPG